MASQDRQLSSPSILSAGAQELPKKHVVTEVTVAIFANTYHFFQALKRKAAHIWRKSVLYYVEECTGMKKGTFQKYVYGTKAVPVQDTPGSVVSRRGHVTNKITPDVLLEIRLQVKNRIRRSHKSDIVRPH